jgi:hypothetical protein
LPKLNFQLDKIIFVGNARDFHAIDWYRTIKRICVNQEVLFATDLIYSEGHAQIVDQSDNITNLYNIDSFLLDRQSSFGNVWRNLIKLFFFPVQVIALKKIARVNQDAVYHAHTMYYLFICWLTGIRYIGSPQGDEILIRPYKSSLYKYFAIQSLRAAEHLIVDSVNLQNGIRKLCGKEAVVIQYGIDVGGIQKALSNKNERDKVISIRAWYPLYRIKEIISARDRCRPVQRLVFFFPFWEEGYKKDIEDSIKSIDINLERLPTKDELYKVLVSSKLAISIPESDSSPRSVYESIFCGCCVAVSYNLWIESLPACMLKRVYVISLEDNDWFEKAVEHSLKVIQEPYIPSEEALNMFDQERSMKKVAIQYYGHN